MHTWDSRDQHWNIGIPHATSKSLIPFINWIVHCFFLSRFVGQIRVFDDLEQCKLIVHIVGKISRMMIVRLLLLVIIVC